MKRAELCGSLTIRWFSVLDTLTALLWILRAQPCSHWMAAALLWLELNWCQVLSQSSEGYLWKKHLKTFTHMSKLRENECRSSLQHMSQARWAILHSFISAGQATELYIDCSWWQAKLKSRISLRNNTPWSEKQQVGGKTQRPQFTWWCLSASAGRRRQEGWPGQSGCSEGHQHSGLDIKPREVQV